MAQIAEAHIGLVLLLCSFWVPDHMSYGPHGSAYVHDHNYSCMMMISRHLQGQKPPGARGSLVPAAGFSFGDFNAYDIGLYSEDSSTSSRSDATQDLLQPVPSLPGLSEPVTVQLGPQHAAHGSTLRLVKQQKAAASTSMTLSPTQHHAWRQGHASKAGGELGSASDRIH